MTSHPQIIYNVPWNNPKNCASPGQTLIYRSPDVANQEDLFSTHDPKLRTVQD